MLGVRRSSLVILGVVALAGCSDSSGPSDTTIELAVDSVASPTNELTSLITGTTDPGATVSLEGPQDTLSQDADTDGAFSFTVSLLANAISEFSVLAVDQAGNQAADTLDIEQDSEAPTAGFVSPAGGSSTLGQSGFTIELGFSEETTGLEYFSGVDSETFEITNSQPVGGVLLQDGTTSTLYPAGSDLTPLFDAVTESGGSWTVPDSAAFTAGPNQMLASISDRVGNESSPGVVAFNVTADPDRLIVGDSEGGAGATGVPVIIGLSNGDSVAGVQFDFVFASATISSVDSVTVRDRASAFDGIDFNQTSPGRVRAVLFDSNGDVLVPGKSAILTLWITLSAAATPADYTLLAEAIILSNPLGGTSTLAPASGTLRVP
jgi:hypothetical protein